MVTIYLPAEMTSAVASSLIASSMSLLKTLGKPPQNPTQTMTGLLALP